MYKYICIFKFLYITQLSYKRMFHFYRASTINFNTTFMCPLFIAGVPFDSVGRFCVNLLLRTTCMRSCCDWSASSVAAQQTKNQKQSVHLLPLSEDKDCLWVLA